MQAGERYCRDARQLSTKETYPVCRSSYALISVAEGRTANEALSAVDQQAAERIAGSLAYISIPKNNNISF